MRLWRQEAAGAPYPHRPLPAGCPGTHRLGGLLEDPPGGLAGQHAGPAEGRGLRGDARSGAGSRPTGPPPPWPGVRVLTVFSLSARLSPLRGESWSCCCCCWGSTMVASGTRTESMAAAAAAARGHSRGGGAQVLGAPAPPRRPLKAHRGGARTVGVARRRLPIGCTGRTSAIREPRGTADHPPPGTPPPGLPRHPPGPPGPRTGLGAPAGAPPG